MSVSGPALPGRTHVHVASRRSSVKVQANLFERIVRVAKSYANALGTSVIAFLTLGINQRLHLILCVVCSELGGGS